MGVVEGASLEADAASAGAARVGFEELETILRQSRGMDANLYVILQTDAAS